MNSDAFATLLHFLDRLEAHGYCFGLAREQGHAVMVRVATPGERWEVQFRDNGSIDVEVFTSTGQVMVGPEARAVLERLFKDTGSDA